MSEDEWLIFVVRRFRAERGTRAPAPQLPRSLPLVSPFGLSCGQGCDDSLPAFGPLWADRTIRLCRRIPAPPFPDRSQRSGVQNSKFKIIFVRVFSHRLTRIFADGRGRRGFYQQIARGGGQMRNTGRSEHHSLVPCVANGEQIRGAENAKSPQKNRLLGSDEPVETRDRWLEEPGGLPVVERDIEWPGATCGGNTADQGILLKVKENECRSNFSGGSRSERKLTDENLSKHVSGRNRKRRRPANPRGETVGRHPSATRHRRSVHR